MQNPPPASPFRSWHACRLQRADDRFLCCVFVSGVRAQSDVSDRFLCCVFVYGTRAQSDVSDRFSCCVFVYGTQAQSDVSDRFLCCVFVYGAPAQSDAIDDVFVYPTADDNLTTADSRVVCLHIKIKIHLVKKIKDAPDVKELCAFFVCEEKRHASF